MICTHPVNDAHGRRLPCGRCINCRINRGQEWSLRLMHELDYWPRSVFATLTYNEEALCGRGTLVPRDLTLFLKRLRKETGLIKYYAVGEYGDQTKRPHYHAIIYGLGRSDGPMITNCWGNGYGYYGNVTPKSISYVTKYINKKLYGDMAISEYVDRVAPMARMSKGLGARWLDANTVEVLARRGVGYRGHVAPIPRYYRKRLKDALTDELYNKELLERMDKKLACEAERNMTASDIYEQDRNVRHQAELDSIARANIARDRKMPGL